MTLEAADLRKAEAVAVEVDDLAEAFGVSRDPNLYPAAYSTSLRDELGERVVRARLRASWVRGM